jgi:hypothetical protein
MHVIREALHQIPIVLTNLLESELKKLSYATQVLAWWPPYTRNPKFQTEFNSGTVHELLKKMPITRSFLYNNGMKTTVKG